MTKDEIIQKLRDMAKYPTVTLPRDCEALKAAADLLSQQAQEIKKFDPNDSFERDEAARNIVREFMRNH